MTHDDPRLTAHALGELEGDERAAVEALIASDPEARAEFEAIRQTVDVLQKELGADSDLALSDAQRAALERALAERAPAPAPVAALPQRRRFRVGWALAAAIPLLLAVGSLTVVGSRRADAPAAMPVAASAVSPLPLPAATEAPASESKAKADRVFEDVKRDPGFSTESYDKFEDNPFIRVATDPRSTFSIDVDTASYSMVRRFLTQDGQLPPKGAVRIEELLNYFSYSYPAARPGELFTVSTEVNDAPWAKGHRLVRIGIKAKDVQMKQRPASNLVFLLDTSGSMNEPNKLPLLKQAFRMLAEQLDERDRVAIVAYAGSSGLVLPPTPGDRKSEIFSALDRLEAGGSTNGGQGIELAYAEAAQALVKGGTNRVILATDGDFNVGTTSQSELMDLITEKAKGGVFLSVLGFGMGNYKDSTLEKLADKGNGNYAYIDNAAEAKKVMVEQGTGTLITVAKDVKIQIELNPKAVEAFRLIGYENRVLAHQDFNDDKKDAGEIGAGHTVTALYEIIPLGGKVPGPSVDGLKYQTPPSPSPAAASGELMTVKLRYKLPEGDQSKLLELAVQDGDATLAGASPDFRFAAAVASFGMLLRSSPFKGDANWAQTIALAQGGIGDSRDAAARRELVELAKKAESLSGR
jgi:Ca-activated chloride channel homolog